MLSVLQIISHLIPQVSRIAGKRFTIWATKEPLSYFYDFQII